MSMPMFRTTARSMATGMSMSGSTRMSTGRRRSAFSTFIRTPIAMPMAASTAMLMYIRASTSISTVTNTIIITITTNMASPAISITAPARRAPMRPG